MGPCYWSLIPPSILTRIKEATSKLSLGKAVVMCNIPAKLFMFSGEPMAHGVHALPSGGLVQSPAKEHDDPLIQCSGSSYFYYHPSSSHFLCAHPPSHIINYSKFSINSLPDVENK